MKIMADLITDIFQVYSRLCSLNEAPEIDDITAKNLLDNLSGLIQQLLVENENIDENVLQALHKIVQFNLNLLLLPRNDSIEEIETDPHLYANYMERAEYVLPVVIQIYRQVLNGDKIKLPLHQVKNNVLLGLNVCGCHTETHPWSNNQLILLNCEFLNEILFTCKCSSLKQMMEGEPGCKFEDGLSKDFFTYMMPKLKSDNWKKDPSNKFVFKWCLRSIKHPNVLGILPEVLTPSLLFVDDFALENKIMGVECLHYIIENVNPTELRMYGRADVVFDALFHLVYTNEAQLIDVLYPCLLEILTIVNQNPSKPDQSLKRDKFDNIFNHLLTKMESEQRLVLRKSYIAQVEPFIAKMGINVVKHMKILLRVIFAYLENYGEVSLKRKTLSALKLLIKTAWPRIPSHMKEILQNLLKFAYDLQTDDTASKETNNKLLGHVTDCLVLVRKTSIDEYESLCQPLYNIEVPPIKTILQTVLLRNKT